MAASSPQIQMSVSVTFRICDVSLKNRTTTKRGIALMAEHAIPFKRNLELD
jgi:hypothetical protein